MISKKELTEEDIKLQFITPAIQNAGYDLKLIKMEYYFTDGKITVRENVAQRGKGKKADYMLFYKPNLPIAIVEAKDNKKELADGIQQAIDYANILDIPFAYSSNGDGFYEHDMLTGTERQISLEEFPTPSELWERYTSFKGITLEEEKIITEPYYFMDVKKTPRYYQRVAINKSVEAIAQGKDRILLVMATGTGKTFTAFQIIHRLWKSGSKKKVLFLADRNILVDQTMNNDFKPFKKVMTKIEHKNMDSSYEIYLSLYHQLKDNERDTYKQFSPDFFDLIIVDECHRSSAKDDSNWHEILTYYSSATQIGLTATPKETNDTSNISYFGDPIYTYSLKQGIDDGFLAPYKVIRVGLDKDLEGYRPEQGMVDEDGYEIEDKEYTVKDFDRTIIIDERTQIVAERITEYLKGTDRYQKTIIFCVDTEHALRMRNALINLNQDLVQANPNYIMRITGNDKLGKLQLDNFIDVNTVYPTIVTTSRLMSTGVDAQTCKLIVLDKPIENMTEFKQIIGRGTRLRPDKGKEYFTIMDFRGNSKNFSDPAFDGEAEVVYDVSGTEPVVPAEIRDIEPVEYNPYAGDVIEEQSKKVHIKGVDVSIINETVQYYDADGKLVTESIAEYSKNNLKRLYENHGDFVHEWIRCESKKEFMEELKADGVMVDVLFNRFTDNVDEFDVLSNLGYEVEPLTKEERIEKVINSDVIQRYNEEQRDIINELLNVYKDKNISEIENLKVLELNNFSRFGGTLPIIKLFEDKANYLDMVRNIGTLIYS